MVMSISKIELKDLTITIRVLKINVIYFMYITGYIFVLMYNDTTFENYFINELNDRGEYILS